MEMKMKFEVRIKELENRVVNLIEERNYTQSLLNEFKFQYYGLTDTHRRDRDFTKLINTIKEVEDVL